MNTPQLNQVTLFVKEHTKTKDAIIQCEIIDHFCCKIEELMQENPHYSMEQAMQNAYQSFGPDGFITFETSAQHALISQFHNEYKNIEKRVFDSKTNYIIASICIFILISSIKYGYSLFCKIIVLTIWLSLFIGFIISTFKNKYIIERINSAIFNKRFEYKIFTGSSNIFKLFGFACITFSMYYSYFFKSASPDNLKLKAFCMSLFLATTFYSFSIYLLAIKDFFNYIQCKYQPYLSQLNKISDATAQPKTD